MQATKRTLFSTYKSTSIVWLVPFLRKLLSSGYPLEEEKKHRNVIHIFKMGESVLSTIPGRWSFKTARAILCWERKISPCLTRRQKNQVLCLAQRCGQPSWIPLFQCNLWRRVRFTEGKGGVFGVLNDRLLKNISSRLCATNTEMIWFLYQNSSFRNSTRHLMYVRSISVRPVSVLQIYVGFLLYLGFGLIDSAAGH